MLIMGIGHRSQMRISVREIDNSREIVSSTESAIIPELEEHIQQCVETESKT